MGGGTRGGQGGEGGRGAVGAEDARDRLRDAVGVEGAEPDGGVGDVGEGRVNDADHVGEESVRHHEGAIKPIKSGCRRTDAIFTIDVIDPRVGGSSNGRVDAVVGEDLREGCVGDDAEKGLIDQDIDVLGGLEEFGGGGVSGGLGHVKGAACSFGEISLVRGVAESPRGTAVIGVGNPGDGGRGGESESDQGLEALIPREDLVVEVVGLLLEIVEGAVEFDPFGALENSGLIHRTGGDGQRQRGIRLKISELRLDGGSRRGRRGDEAVVDAREDARGRDVVGVGDGGDGEALAEVLEVGDGGGVEGRNLSHGNRKQFTTGRRRGGSVAVIEREGFLGDFVGDHLGGQGIIDSKSIGVRDLAFDGEVIQRLIENQSAANIHVRSDRGGRNEGAKQKADNEQKGNSEHFFSIEIQTILQNHEVKYFPIKTHG